MPLSLNEQRAAVARMGEAAQQVILSRNRLEQAEAAHEVAIKEFDKHRDEVLKFFPELATGFSHETVKLVDGKVVVVPDV